MTLFYYIPLIFILCLFIYHNYSSLFLEKNISSYVNSTIKQHFISAQLNHQFNSTINLASLYVIELFPFFLLLQPISLSLLLLYQVSDGFDPIHFAEVGKRDSFLHVLARPCILHRNQLIPRPSFVLHVRFQVATRMPVSTS